MSETTINQRLKFLLEKLEMKARAFARALNLSETTIRNYTDRTAKPSSDVLEKISNTFKQVNLVWLITGQGDPFLYDTSSSSLHESNTADATTKNFSTNHITGKNTGSTSNSTGGINTHNHHTGSRDDKQALAIAQQEIEHLRAQLESTKATLAAANALIASKDDFITLLRASYNRPN